MPAENHILEKKLKEQECLLAAEHEQQLLAEALGRVGLALNAVLDLPHLLDLICQESITLFEVEAACVWLVQGAELVGFAGQGPEREKFIGLRVPLADTQTLGLRVIREKRPIFVNEVSQSNEVNQKLVKLFQVKALLGIPLITKDRAIGALVIADTNQAHRFGPDDVEIAAVFGNYATIAIQNAHLHQDAQKALQLSDSLREIGASLAVTMGTEEVLERILDGLGNIIPFDSASVMLLENQVFHLKAQRGLPVESFIRDQVFSFDEEGPNYEIYYSKKPLIVPDVQQEPDWVMLTGLEYIRSWLGIPLLVRDQVIGILTLDKSQPNFYTEQHATIAIAFAQQAAIALENARLFDETHRQAQQLTVLNELAREMTALRDLETLLYQIVERAVQLLSGDGGSIYLYRPEHHVLERVVTMGEEVGPVRTTLGRNEGLAGRIWATGQPLLVDDYGNWPGRLPEWSDSYTLAIVGVPIQSGNEFLGVLTTYANNTRRRFNTEDAALLSQFAPQAAIAIQNASLYEQVQHYATELEARVAERTFELQVLYELAQALGQATQLGDVVRLILLYLYQTIPHDVAASLLMTGATGTLVIQSQHPLLAEVETQIQEMMTSTLGHLRSQALDTTTLEVRRIQSRAEAATRPPLESLASLMQVPILVGQVPVGLLLIATEQQNQFSKEQAFLLRTMADQAAESIQRLQSLLAAEHQRLESLVVHLPDGVILLDAEQRIVLANQAAQKSLALLTRATIGDKLTELGGQPLAPLLLTDSAGSSYEVEIKAQLRQVFDVTAKPMAVGPEAGGWMLMIRDISEERATQQRIQQQERLAAVGQLAAGIAHDFNNILTSVIGFAELARIHPDIPDAAGEDLDRIIRQGQRATRLIRQILDFSRQSIAEKRQVDPVPFLKETIKLLERTIPEDIRIILEIEPGEYMLNADPTQLQQALTNLAVNARDAMPTGGVLRFHLSSLVLKQDERPPCSQLLPGHWIALSISDTGVGISPEVLPRIFEPFFTTKEVGKGTGLGLAQVYGIITQHEGCIDVETRVGVGTTLRLYLPALSAWQRTLPQVAEVKVVPGEGEVILLVEDDAAVLEVTQAMLKHLGYQVVTATNGQHALEVYEQHQAEIALVLTDATMPEMGGVALSQALQAKNPAIKVVALTGYPLEAGAKDLLARGIIDWLQKPLNIEQLAQTISRSLKSKDEQDRLPIDF